MQRWRTRHDIRGICFDIGALLAPVADFTGDALSDLLPNIGGANFLQGLASDFGGGLLPETAGLGNLLQGNPISNLFQLSTLGQLFPGGGGGIPGLGASMPIATATSSYNPSVNQRPMLTGLINQNLDINSLAGPGGNAAASASGGGFGIPGIAIAKGGAGGSTYTNVDYSPSASITSNAPAVPGLPGLSPAMPAPQMPQIRETPMPAIRQGSPLANMMPTPQPIAAGGISPTLAAMLAVPQQQQIAPSTQIIPGTASQSGGYDQPQQPPPMPQGQANAMGIPTLTGGVSQAQTAPTAAPGNIMTAGGQQVPFSQATASNPWGLVPPPPPTSPSLAQLPYEPDFAQQEASTPVEPNLNSLEQDALNRAKALGDKANTAVTEYVTKQKADKEAREQEKRPRLEKAGNDLAQARARKRELDELKRIQNAPGGQRLLQAKAQQDAFNAVQDRMHSGEFPIQQVRVPKSYPPARFGPRSKQAAETIPDPVQSREMQSQTGQLYNQVYESQLKYYQRDLKDDIADARQDIKDAEKQFTDLEKEFKDRENNERKENLSAFNVAMAQVRSGQTATGQEGRIGSSVAGRKQRQQLINAQVPHLQAQTQHINQLIESQPEADASRRTAQIKNISQALSTINLSTPEGQKQAAGLNKQLTDLITNAAPTSKPSLSADVAAKELARRRSARSK
jgi:hypothetical protein